MELRNGPLTVTLTPPFYGVTSILIGGREFCAPGGETRPLFTCQLLQEDGTPVRCTAREAENVTAEDGKLVFRNLAGKNVDAEVSVRPLSGDGLGWSVTVDNRSGLLLEWTEFPQLTVAGPMKGQGGDTSLFWPAIEGQVIDDPTVRERLMPYQEIRGQSNGGFGGFYPGSCPMQFMAYYGSGSGLYFAAHDPHRTPKTVEFYRSGDGIALEYRIFCGGAAGKWTPGFEMVTAAMNGDWQDAAERYRRWMEAETALPPKLRARHDLPDWMTDSPIVMLYPIRGTIDHGDMTPNEYYPYANALPVAARLGRETGSRIMALPMHWEGTAPWATPYVWPPYGGEAQFTRFIGDLHAQGNLAGVYCSGIGWTTKSFLNPGLDFSDRYDETLMCRTARGTIEQSKVIGAPIRLGYDMCPVSPKVARIVAGEVTAIARSGCDYAQYFDQNLGGEAALCYGRDHGHPPAPGVWENEAMLRIFEYAHRKLAEQGSAMVLGCEGAASEPFVGALPMNDLRYQFGFCVGQPVPAYAWLFHEYINNFMGNQCGIGSSQDFSENPDSLRYRIAYSFTAGDMLTVCLGKGGSIIWGWGVEWDVEPPAQEPVLTLLGRLNAMRRTYAPYLHLGRMVRPRPVETAEDFLLIRRDGSRCALPGLLTSRWENSAGTQKQVIVNFREKPVSCRVDGKTLTVPPLDAVWID